MIEVAHVIEEFFGSEKALQFYEEKGNRIINKDDFIS
jgi:hypothetical protein